MASSGPNQPSGPLGEAMALHQRGKLNPAKKIYREIVARQPRNADVLELLGLVHAELGELSDAVRVLEQAEQITPESVNVVFNLGMALRRLGRLTEAEPRLRKAVALGGVIPETHFQLGATLFALNRPAEAEIAFRESLRQNSRQPEALHNLGQALVMQGKLEEAVTTFERAAALDPKSAVSLCELGRTLLTMSNPAQALIVLNKAVSLQPESESAWALLGAALRLSGRNQDARNALERAHTLDKDDANTLLELIAAKRSIADWNGLDRLSMQISRMASRPDSTIGSTFVLMQIDDPLVHRATARANVKSRWPGSVAGSAASATAIAAVSPSPRRSDGRINVAYVSSFLGNHSQSYAIAGLLAAHDRKTVAVHVLSTAPGTSAGVRPEIADSVEHLHHVAAKSAAEVATLCQSIGIDIAIDLCGHTAGARTDLFAARIAPVQASFMAFPSTMGLATMDYAIVDDFVAPSGADATFDEALVRLPACYLPNDLKREGDPPPRQRSSMGLPADGLVLAALGPVQKITPEMFACWMRIMQRAESSVLLLSATTDATADALRSQARANGVDGSRIIVAPMAMVRSDILATVSLADLFLDVHPYSSETLAADALWMGVPVVTLAGRSMAARITGSLLHSAGLDAQITASLADYETAAVKLLTDATLRTAVKDQLSTARASTPVFDMSLFARRLEWAYARMMERRSEGRAPEAIAVPSSIQKG